MDINTTHNQGADFCKESCGKFQEYQRFYIHTKKAKHLFPHPCRFSVKVNRLKLAKHILKEIVEYWGKWDVVLSRPCVYGVFSGPLGGFAPRQHLCVGCLRCTTQYPDMVTILRNPARDCLGDAFFTPDHVEAVAHEAETGRIPIRGAGYKGKFGGSLWDGMWTDMSEIVRPTRDGIHGREYISTSVDIGGKPAFLSFDEAGNPQGAQPQAISTPIPMLFDAFADSVLDKKLAKILVDCADALKTFVILPLKKISEFSLKNVHIIPRIGPNDLGSLFNEKELSPSILEMSFWDLKVYQTLKNRFPKALVILRAGYEEINFPACYDAGLRIFHLGADYHGRSPSGKFALELIREANKCLVDMRCRDEVTLIGSGGIVAAEHLAKAILCGLDAIALDTPLLVALQAQFKGDTANIEGDGFKLHADMPIEWGKQRIKNLIGAWYDQLLEIMGAMGLREVRRMRGEIGRAMFQKKLEMEAFGEIAGYEYT